MSHKSPKRGRLILRDNDFINWVQHRIKKISLIIGIERISVSAYEPLTTVVQAKLAETISEIIDTSFKVITPDMVTCVVGKIAEHPFFLPKAQFGRLVRQLAQNGGSSLEDKKWSPEAIDILRGYSEVLFMDVLTIAKLFIDRAKQVVLTDKDIEMAVKSRTACNRGPYM